MNSKLELRIEAARLAVESGAENFSLKAKEIYSFIEGKTDLPEVYNPNDLLQATMSQWAKSNDKNCKDEKKEIVDTEEKK